MEKDLQGMLAKRLSGFGFYLTREVVLRHFSGKHLRIDFIAQPEFPFPAEFVGIECKYRYPEFTDFTAALKQAIDYRQSVVADPRLPSLLGKAPSFVFVFPDITPYNGPSHPMAGGAERLAGKFNVGVIKEDHGELRMFVNASPLWGNNRGLVANADSFSTNRHPGHL